MVQNHKSIYDSFMSDSNFDPNPAKYLVVYGNDDKFKSALRNLSNLDEEIGEETSVVSNKAMVRYLNILIAQREEEILLRDERIQELIENVHRLYSSKRYKLGHLVLNPIEKTLNLFKK